MKKSDLKKAGIALFVMWGLTQLVFARGLAINDDDFRTLSQKSDLIVIAHVLESSKTTPEEATLTNISPAIKVLGMETKFLPSIVLKGDLTNQFIIVHHYRLPDSSPLYNSGPMLVSFSASTQNNYLLFLKREADVRCAPAGGQTDAAISIRRIANFWETPNEISHKEKDEGEMERQWQQQTNASTDAPLTVEFVKMEAVDEVRKRGDLKVINKTAKAVNRCSLQLFFFNLSGKVFEINSMGVIAANGEHLADAHGEFSTQARGNTDNYETSRVEAVVTAVEFADGTKWNAPAAHWKAELNFIKSVAIIGACITGLTARQIWLSSRCDERRTPLVLHRLGGTRPNGEIARLADGADCARHFGGVNLCSGEGIGAQNRTLARHHGFGIFAVAQKRVAADVRRL